MVPIQRLPSESSTIALAFELLSEFAAGTPTG